MRTFLLIIGLLCCNNIFAQISYNIDLIYHWKDTTLVPSTAHDNTYNEVWGFVQNGKEYGVIGSTAGTHIFDLSKPWNIEQIVFIPGETQGKELIHRDYHDYKGYLYIVSDENDLVNGDTSKLKIADISYLPDSVHIVYNEKTFFTRSHNIFIDSAKAKLYTCGGDNNPGVRVFSLVDPENPVEISSVAQGSHDIYVINDTAYVNGGNEGLFIYDFSDNNNPQLIGSLTAYPQQGYNHSGWLTNDRKTYLLADENHGMDIKILDVTDLNNINVLDTIDTELDSNYTIPHNIMIRDNYAFVAYYFDGLYVFNIEDPSNSFISGYYHTSQRIHQNNKYQGNWGVYCLLPSGLILASDMQNGFFVFDVDNALSVPEPTAKKLQLNLYPNPTNDRVIIENIPNENFNFCLFTIDGKSVLNGKIDNYTIDIPKFVSSGSYILHIFNENHSYQSNLIINSD